MKISESIQTGLEAINNKIKMAKSMKWHFQNTKLQLIREDENGRTGVWSAIEITRSRNFQDLFNLAEFIQASIEEEIEIDRSEPREGFNQDLVLAIVPVFTMTAIREGIGSDTTKFKQLVDFENE